MIEVTIEGLETSIVLTAITLYIDRIEEAVEHGMTDDGLISIDLMLSTASGVEGKIRKALGVPPKER